MGVQFLFLGTLPLCLVSAVDGAHAQSASRDSEVLPAIEVVAPTTDNGQTSPEQGRAQAPATCAGFWFTRRPLRLRRAPEWMSTRCRRRSMPSVPRRSRETDSLNIGDALQQQVPGVILSDTTGNPFMPDIQFRGFTASPVAGTPQGLAVYQNGMRINEAFGDTVNWDLIPTAAIRSVTVVTNNPAFGLNALGGAVNVLMKDGFSYQGAETNIMGGSSGASRARRRPASR